MIKCGVATNNAESRGGVCEGEGKGGGPHDSGGANSRLMASHHHPAIFQILQRIFIIP
jgi:hypothetical protein